MASGGVEQSGRRAYSVLRHRDYRLIWSAEFVSTTGTQMQRVAIAWQVYDLTGDALKLGLLGLARFVPILIFGMLGGVLADQRDRRKILFVSQSALMITSLVLATASAFGDVSTLLIYGITLVSGAFSAMGQPARQSLIPNLVPRDELSGAMSMNVLSMQMATVAGPALGGLAIAAVGPGLVYLIDSMTFVVVIAAIAAMKARPASGGVTSRTFESIREGFVFLRQSPILLGVMSVDFIATFFGAATTLMPIFAEEILGAGPGGMGLLLAAPAAGAFIGGAVMSARPMPDRPGYGVLAAVIAYGVAIAAFGLSTSFALSLLFLGFSGASDAVSVALRSTVRNLITPDSLRGRIAATHSIFAMGGPQLGELRAGASASVIGAGPAVAVGGLLTVLSSVAVSFLVPGIKKYRVSDPDNADVGNEAQIAV
jgi:Transmembrane secretion effector